MNKIKIAGVVLMLIVANMQPDSSANSISLNSDVYVGLSGEIIEVTVIYDATDFPIFGGSFNIIYDPTVLQFISYSQAEYPLGIGWPQDLGDFSGELSAPGHYLNAWVGTFDLHNGMFFSGEAGTFQFLVQGEGGDAGCGSSICMTNSGGAYTFNSLTGADVTDEMFANGVTSAIVVAEAVPIPAALWLLLSGIGVLRVFSRKTYDPLA